MAASAHVCAACLAFNLFYVLLFSFDRLECIFLRTTGQVLESYYAQVSTAPSTASAALSQTGFGHDKGDSGGGGRSGRRIAGVPCYKGWMAELLRQMVQYDSCLFALRPNVPCCMHVCSLS